MKIDVKNIAKLANLEIEENEIDKFEKQLSEIIEYINKLNNLDTANIKTTEQVTGLISITREDSTQPSILQEDALSNAKSEHNNLFKVKAILEEE